MEHVLCSTIWIGFTVGCLGRQILSIAFRADAPSGDTKLLFLVVTGFDDVVVVVVVTCCCLLLVACCSLLVLREPKVTKKHVLILARGAPAKDCAKKLFAKTLG